MTHYKPYPFTAIVGQDLMKLALILNAINPKIGGVLIKGTKGTAKSTAVRALADLLPEIEVIKDCPFNCNPKNLKESCHSCQDKIIAGDIEEKNIILKEMRVINLPINSTEDRVVGTIDIKEAIMKGIKALEPGILAEANRNILYIDEVNLLADNVADILLDSAAMGLNIIEREGISFHHPSNFILIGTMNPEEGNLRPQLLDRFGLSVDVERIENVEERVLIIKNVEDFQENPNNFYSKFKKKQKDLRNKIIKARKNLNLVQISEEDLKKIAQLCINFRTDGHRADITITRAAKTIATFKGRTVVNEDDIKIAAKLSLSHRLRRLPFEDQTFNENDLEEMFEKEKELKTDKNNLNNNTGNHQILNVKEEVFEINKDIKADKIIPNKKIRKVMNTSGQRIIHPTSSNRGKYIGGQKPKNLNIPATHDIALNETLNEAALEPENINAIRNGKKLIIKEDHIHIKKRTGKSSYLIIFCVDASGSIGANGRMEVVKGTIFSILQSNYVFRDKVSLIVFRKDKAELILPPTRSTDLAHKLLKEIPTGGTTPLVAGLLKAMDVALEENQKQTGYLPLIILLTDARGNVYYKDAIDDVLKTGEQISKNNISTIIIDVEDSNVKLEICKKIAKSANAAYYHIDNLSNKNINEILTNEGVLEKN
ncbi:MAG: magnesium chelatase subunit D family protein [Promethearchaeota archaeon]